MYRAFLPQKYVLSNFHCIGISPLGFLIITNAVKPIAPALEAVEYQRVNFRDHYSDRDTYRGPPTPDREAAWEEFAPC